MNNHLTQPQKTLLRQYFSKTLILQGFQTAKNRAFSPFLSHFLPILEVLQHPIYQKNAETLMFSAF
jgi:hypothetical protein